MTSRRAFIKGAGVVAGAFTWPEWFSTSKTHKSVFKSTGLETDDELFAMVRQQLLIPKDRIYLNTGSLGPSPISVIDTVHEITRQLESNPVGENWGQLGNAMEMVREKVAGFINANKDEILLTRNTTEGLSLISTSLNLQAGDEILTTTQEHGGALTGMEFVEKHKGILIKKVSLSTPTRNRKEVVTSISKAITAKTKLILLSHINTATGLVMPFSEIAKITKNKGIILVADGAQAPGLIKVDVQSLGVDAYAASGHKWLMGPKETGFLYLSQTLASKVNNVFIHSGLAAYSASSGTRNVATIIGLGAAIDFHEQIGVLKIQKRCLEIRNYCKAELQKIAGLKITSPAPDHLSCGIVCFTLEKAVNHEVYAALGKENIIIKLLPGGNDLRISCHMFVSKEDIDIFVKALQKLI